MQREERGTVQKASVEPVSPVAVHSYPDSHEYGLADDCPRCEQHARDPLRGLDDDNVTNLLWRVETGQPPRSTNEAIAMAHIRDAIAVHDRLSSYLQNLRR